VPSDRTAVVIPAYNASRWIGETLDSLLAQTANGWTCVVVDDGSTDGTADLVRSRTVGDDRFTVVSQANAGVSAARNTGLRHVPSDSATVAFVDSDDLWLPSALASLRAALERRPDAAGVTGLARHVDETGHPIDLGAQEARLRGRPCVRRGLIGLLPPERDTDFASLAISGRIWPPAVGLFRLRDVAAVGDFDTSLWIGEDWDFYLRLARRGPLAFLDEVVADYRQHAESATADSWDLMITDLDRVRRKAWEEPTNTPEQRAAVRRGWEVVELAALLSSGRQTLWALQHRDWSLAGNSAASARAFTRSLAGRVPPLPDPSRAGVRRPMVVAVRRAVLRAQAASRSPVGP